MDQRVFSYLRSLSNKFLQKNKTKTLQTQFQRASKFFEKHTGFIEAVFSTNSLSKVYFWLNPECHYLNEEIKEAFREQADRTSSKNKLIYLIEKSDYVIDQIKNEYKISNLISKYKSVYFISKIKY